MNLIRYKIDTNDGCNFIITFSDFSVNVLLEAEDRLFVYEEKCIQTISEELKNKNLDIIIDPYMIIELAADLWSKRIKFSENKILSTNCIILD